MAIRTWRQRAALAFSLYSPKRLHIRRRKRVAVDSLADSHLRTHIRNLTVQQFLDIPINQEKIIEGFKEHFTELGMPKRIIILKDIDDCKSSNQERNKYRTALHIGSWWAIQWTHRTRYMPYLDTINGILIRHRLIGTRTVLNVNGLNIFAMIQVLNVNGLNIFAMIQETNTSHGAGLIKAALAGAWQYWITKRDVWVLTKPQFTLINDEIHNERGPAVWWPNMNLEMYFWRGIHVDPTVIKNPDSIPVQNILRERNMEIQRTMIERIGWEKVFKALGNPKPHHVDETGELYRVRIGRTTYGLVKVKDASTNRRYFLMVPPGIGSAKRAVAWTFGYHKKDWNPKEQT
jgi:hypothetical protein